MMLKTIGLFLLQSIILFSIALPTLSLSNAAHILGNETDRLALLAFKDGITQDPLRVMNSWNDSIHFCEWEGVTCSQQHRRVVVLNLRSKGLIGFISPYIGNLSFLRTIDLQNNSFHSEIPQEVGRLFRLQMILMSNNSLSGHIPTNLSHCSNLINIIIARNKLVGEIPMEFGSLSKLITLALHDNNFTGRLPPSFGNISSLEALGITENSFYGSIPDSIGQLKRLEYISLAANMFSGMVPRSFYNISSLQFISFAGNQLEGNLPPDVGRNLPNLSGFFIGGNQFSGSIPVSLLTNASRIQNLELAFNSFTGNVPIEVGSLTDLQVLALGTNDLGSGGKDDDDLNFLTSLNNCTYLQVLDIYSNRFGGRLPGSIVNLSNTFSYLYLGDNQIVGSIPPEIGKLINLVLLSVDINFLTGVIPKGIGMLQNLQLLGLSANRFSGLIPQSIGNNSQLYLLDLSDNELEGKVVPNFDKYRSLQILNFSHNQLNGTIPKRLFELSQHLTRISLAHNSLIGPLLSEVGNLQNLQILDISKNKISGEIPGTLGSCLSLENLYLQGNLLGGTIPSSLSSLKGIQTLDISQNNLSGEIPKFLENLAFLKSLNLSFNNFEGEVPIKGIFRNASAISLVGNHKLCGGIPKLDLLTCYNKKFKKHRKHLALKITLGVLIPLFVVVSLFLALYLTKRPVAKPSSKEFLEHSLKRISYNELRKATDGFSSTNLIGIGSHGSVYRGVLNQNQGPVAVKVLNLVEKGASKSFMAECQVLRKVRHRNLLKIFTVCSSVNFEGKDFKALVFQFMSNGSVENWLHPSSNPVRPSRNLNLLQRLNIAIDVASALDYLHNHCETPIVHCDLKSSNVLLDDDMVAYVGDFGIAKFLCMTSSEYGRSQTNSIGVRGTIGYIPPEYGMGAQVSTQGDLYSYGILLLEMITGKRPTDEMFKDGLNLHEWTKLALTDQGEMDIIDTRLLFEGTPDETISDIEEKKYTIDQVQECFISIMTVGVTCSSQSISERMDIKDVLKEMHAIKRNLQGSKFIKKNEIEPI